MIRFNYDLILFINFLIIQLDLINHSYDQFMNYDVLCNLCTKQGCGGTAKMA